MTKRAALSPAQLGALTRGALVEIDDGTRRSVELYCASSNAEIWTRIATDDDGNEFTVLSFPASVWPDVLEAIGADPDQDKLKIGGMIWLCHP
ncbi:hypothetical protein HUG10_21305 (plasmid) [Halorarum halophilum]|uniref:Uncharacterized protein n=1 Tax=Halorarum halophilum TaxID=2743090 RepID=A0A7D5GPU2_9EURY|nr:hypothetical protein [Halobaculum halophilum]QLG30127.1 hypothetical protein HUG10_21305 [Halobaculum halophilum]